MKVVVAIYGYSAKTVAYVKVPQVGLRYGILYPRTVRALLMLMEPALVSTHRYQVNGLLAIHCDAQPIVAARTVLR